MASYGIGVERLIGTIVEIHHDEKGMIWPTSIAPYLFYLLEVGESSSALKKFGEQVYNRLEKFGVEILYDDREKVSAGEKFADADLVGLPWRLVISEKTLVQEKIEIKRRDEKKSRLIKLNEIKNYLKR